MTTTTATPHSFYDDLGVSPDATQAEIRAAYRTAARVNHPDREGGNADAMARANLANDVLSDPARRKRYDETGSDHAGRSLQQMARDLLRAVFAGTLDSGAPLALARMSLTETSSTIRIKRHATGKALDKLRDKLGMVTVLGDGPNLYVETLAKRIEEIETDMAMAAEAIRVHDLALTMLDGYASSEPTPVPSRRIEVRVPALEARP